MAWDSDFRRPDKSALTPAQEAGLAALFRAIQPSDPERGIPGADEAGAAHFVGLLLARDPDGPVRIHPDLAAWQNAYPGWLAELETIAQGRFSVSLADCDVGQAGELIAALEGGTLKGFSGDQGKAFGTLWRHCLQGCWSDPRWGGNRDRIMWRWLGHLYDPQNVVIADAEGGDRHAPVR